MKLTIFESDSGDCVLLEGASRHLVLCDGGMKGSLQRCVRAELSRLGRPLDLVYVSHIDDDHIGGVLQLLEDLAEWRVYEFHQHGGDPIRPPRVPRPPEIKGILHNAFRDQVGPNEEAIRELLTTAAPALYASAVPELVRVADRMEGIAAGIPEALKVSRLIGPDALDIPLNAPPGVERRPALAGARPDLLRMGAPGDRFTLGSMKFTLVGPGPEELEALGRGWDTWLRKNQARVKAIRTEIKRRVEDFSSGLRTGSPYDLGDWNGVSDVEGVTPPNVASMMFLVEEGGKTLLLPGDGQQGVILAGLERAGFLEPGHLHLDVLKVQHHGSENNLDAGFARTVSADHYVFCGNGLHGNPDRRVVDALFASRLGGEEQRARSPKARGRPFHFWFSSTARAAPARSERRKVLEALEAHVKELQARSNGLLQLHHNAGASTVLEV